MRITKYKTELVDNRHTVLVKESACNYASESRTFNSPDVIVKMLNNCFRLNKQAEEYVYMLALDSHSHLLGVFEVTHGTANYSVLNPREILVRALLCGATCIVLSHNHPSGNIEPSREDISVTKRTREACDLIGIKLFDHIIIGDDCYVSLMENGNI